MIKIHNIIEMINIKTYYIEFKNFIYNLLIKKKEYEYKSLNESYPIID